MNNAIQVKLKNRQNQCVMIEIKTTLVVEIDLEGTRGHFIAHGKVLYLDLSGEYT